MRRFFETCRRCLPWIVVSLVVVPVIVGVASRSYMQSYQATASLWVDASAASLPSDPNGTKTAADVYASTLQQLLMTQSFEDTVLRDVERRTGQTSPSATQRDALLGQIGSGTKVNALGSNLIEVTFKDKDSAFAVGVVGSVIDAYQQRALALQKDATAHAANLYQNQIRQTQDDVTTAQALLTALPASAPDAERARLATNLQARQDLLKLLDDRQNAAYTDNIAALATAPSALQVIDAAHTGNKPRTNWVTLGLAVVGTFLVMLIADLAVITLLTLSDRSVRTAADVTALTELPVAAMPRVYALPDGAWPRFTRGLLGK